MKNGGSLTRGLGLFVALLAVSSTIFGQKIETTVVSFDPVFEDREVARKPGTLLFESGKFKLQNNYNTVTAQGLNLKLPKDTKEVTWSVEFINLGVGRAGLLLYDPPTVGKSHNDFWEKTKDGWELKSVKENANFASRLAGVPDGTNDEVIVYENAKKSLGKTYLSGREVGDTVVLHGNNSYLTAIQFEYFAALSPFGAIPEGRLRVYLNDGERIFMDGLPGDPRGDLELQAQGAIVYDNPRGKKEDVHFIEGETGDTFTIDSEHRIINTIQFEYLGALNPFEKNQNGLLRIYANDGEDKAPGTLLFESKSFALQSGYNMVTASDLKIELPKGVNDATWTVEFSGLGKLGKAALLLNDKPKTGQSANTFWVKTGEGDTAKWTIKNAGEGRGNFAARIAAQVPPPPAISTDRQEYISGEPIKVTFANGPKNPKDWVGLYRAGMIPGSAAAPDWAYVSGTRTAGEGLPGGAIMFTSVLPSGDYVARFFKDDGYDQLAQYEFKILPAPSVAPAKPEFGEGESLVMNFDHGPGNAKDWIAVYRPETDPSKLPSLAWSYVGGSQTSGEGLSKGTVSLPNKLAVGQYVVRYFENDTYKQLAEATFKVRDTTAPVITLKGQASITIDAGAEYVDVGATAVDNIDGDLTSFIAVNNTVDTSKPGTYTVTYNVVDKADNAAAEVSRTVTVIDAAPLTLSIQRNADGTVTVIFGGDLQSAPAVDGPWQSVDGSGEVTLPAGQAKQFFRATR